MSPPSAAASSSRTCSRRKSGSIPPTSPPSKRWSGAGASRAAAGGLRGRFARIARQAAPGHPVAAVPRVAQTCGRECCRWRPQPDRREAIAGCAASNARSRTPMARCDCAAVRALAGVNREEAADVMRGLPPRRRPVAGGHGRLGARREHGRGRSRPQPRTHCASSPTIHASSRRRSEPKSPAHSDSVKIRSSGRCSCR